MKKNKKILIFTFIVILIVSVATFAYANDNNGIIVSAVEYTDEFKQWLNLSDEEKSKTIMPRAYNVEFSSTKNTTNPILRMKMVMAANQAKYSLQTVIPENLEIKDQQSTGACWTFAALSSLETNLAMQDKKAGVNPAKVYDYSERHMEYSTSKTFLNGKINENGFNREVDTGGNFLMAQAYLTNGQGAVKESEMPFEDNANKIDISEIQNKNVATQVYDTIPFTNYAKLTTDEEKEEAMNQIKKHIQNYGSVFATIHAGTEAAPANDCYNAKTGAKFCGTSYSSENHPLDHGISIVGWDDNYSVDNFNSKNKPSKNGAWIVRNSWGSKVGDNGYIYVSYEDYDVATNLYGIQKSTDRVNYDKIYQYDTFGGSANDHISFSNSSEKRDVMIYNVFDRNSSDTEYLTGISIEAPEKYTCKVYINPNGSEVTESSMEQITLKSGETQTIDLGYHTLEFDKAVKLNGSQFVVLVQIKSDGDNVLVENSKIDGKYANVKTETGKCYYAYANDIKSANWNDFSKLDDSTRGDTTIKAFTTNELDDGSLKNIKITKQPKKTKYFEGDNFDSTGLEITANYNSKTKPSEILDSSKYTIENGTNLKKGQKSITIKYEDQTIEVPIEVNENSVVGIKVKNPPSKTEYKEGQKFDQSGMIIEATYAEGSTKEVSDYKIENGNNVVIGQTDIIISYGGQTTSQKISVSENKILELKIVNEPNKTTYNTGENFDKTGMKVEGKYEDGETIEILDYEIKDGENLQLGQDTITISYKDIEVEQKISVVKEEKAQNSEFKNLVANVKNLNIKGNIELNPDDSNVSIKMDVEISGVKRNLNNDKMEYYYYLSNNRNEKNIANSNWIKVNDEQTENDKIKISNIDFIQFKNLDSSDNVYLYVKEVAIKGSSKSEYVTVGMDVKLEQEDNNKNDNNSNNNNSNNNSNINNGNNSGNSKTKENINLTDNSSKGSINGNQSKNNFTNGIITRLPNAGNKYGILIMVIIISGIAVFTYIRYKKLSKYTK